MTDGIRAAAGLLGRGLAAVCAIVVLAACAGLHALPVRGYSAGEEGTADRPFRLVFDQWGDLYPKSRHADRPDAGPWSIPVLTKYNFNSGFSVQTSIDCHGLNRNENCPRIYNGAALQSEAIAQLRAAIAAKRSQAGADLVVVFQVAGFSSKFSSSEADMKLIRNRLIALDPNPNRIFVEVYWDSLYIGDYTFSPGGVAPFYWFESQTYSNFAGELGLRQILQAVPTDVRIAVITKSRGAAVAVSAFVTPHYDVHIKGKDRGDYVPSSNPVWSRQADTAVVMFAPAIGSGHLGPLLSEKQHSTLDLFADAVTHVSMTYNPEDPATRKGIGAEDSDFADRFGSTALNAISEFAVIASKRLRAQGVSVFQARFENGGSHDTDAYMSRGIGHLLTHCMFANVGLVRSQPAGGCQQFQYAPVATK